MDIGSILLNLLAGGGAGGAPGAAVPAGPMAAPPPGGPTTPAPAPAAPAPAPAPTAMADPLPESYKSPPDLVSMYAKLMQKSNEAEAMNRGMTLVAAGLAQDQNKGKLIEMASQMGGGGSGSGAPTMADLIAMQKMQIEDASRQKRAAQLPGLMDRYGLDPATVQYLDATDQLDETISALAKPGTEVVEAADGSKKLINSDTGATIKELSPAKPRETEYIDAPDGSGGKVLVYKDTKEPYAGGPAITDIAKPKGAITVETLADGTKQPVQDGKPIGTPFGPAELSSMQQELVSINAAHKAAGEPEETLDQWIIRRSQAGTEAGTIADINKKKFGNPPAGKYFQYNADGSIQMNADGTPVTVWDQNSKEYLEYKAAEEKAKAEADAAATEAGKTADADASSAVKQVIQYQNVTDAIKMIDDNEDKWIGVGGWAGTLGWLPNSEQKTFSNLLYSVKTNIGLDALQQMRASSKTGGALGSVTEGEHKMLAQVWGSLDETMDPKVIRYNLRRIQAGLDVIANGVPDPSAPGGYRKPTEADVAAAMGTVSKEEGSAPSKMGVYNIERLDTPPPAVERPTPPLGRDFFPAEPGSFVPLNIPPRDPNWRVPTGN